MPHTRGVFCLWGWRFSNCFEQNSLWLDLGMMRRIIPLLFLIHLFGCKEVPLYFRSAQPRRGISFNADITKFLINNIPKTMNSDDNNSLLFDALNDTLTSIEINRHQNIAKVNLGFFNGLTWIEEFDLSDSSFMKFFFGKENHFLDKGIDEYVILEKENIICFNDENDKGYFEIDMIFERNRINGDLMIYDKPFSVSKKNSLKDFDELFSYKRDEFDLAVVGFNDTLKTYSADPSYMGFRWFLNQVPTDIDLGSYYIIGLAGIFENRIEMDSTKYKDIIEFLDF